MAYRASSAASLSRSSLMARGADRGSTAPTVSRSEAESGTEDGEAGKRQLGVAEDQKCYPFQRLTRQKHKLQPSENSIPPGEPYRCTTSDD